MVLSWSDAALVQAEVVEVGANLDPIDAAPC